MRFVPSVCHRFACGGGRVPEIRIVRENTVRCRAADLTSVLNQPLYAFLGPCTGADQTSWRGLGAFGDDVDHTIDGIRAPDRPAGASDHFDSLDIL